MAVTAASFVFFLFFAAILGGNIERENREALAMEMGFESVAEMEEAQSEGISLGQEWAAQRDEIRTARQREADVARAAAEVVAEAEARAAEEAEAEAEARAAAAVEAEARAEARAEIEERRRGFHCLSDWDGSHRVFRRAIRQAMRNPSSFEHVETRITPVDENGAHTIIMTYRAENGFGGMTVGQAVGLVDSETCSAVVLSVE